MPHLSRAARAFALLALVAAAALLPGCSHKGPPFVEQGSTYTTQTVDAVYDRADVSKLANVSVDKADALRHDALTGLRSRGTNGATVADLITKTLQSEQRAVPIYVELATVSGKHAVVLVEAVGKPGGTLDRKRLWVFDEGGNVIYAGSR